MQGTDVSLHSARIHGYSALRTGSTIWLPLPKLGQIDATIIWSNDFEAGCQFREALDDASFALLTAH